MFDQSLHNLKFVETKQLTLEECNCLADLVKDRRQDLGNQLDFTKYLIQENNFLGDMVRVRIEKLTDSQLIDLF